MEYNEEFKQALSNLPDKEKDKLILRLLKRDHILANRLYFELIQPISKEELRENLIQDIECNLEKSKDEFFLPWYAVSDLREISGKISKHLAITKDKYGEVLLQLTMIDVYLKKNIESLKMCNLELIHKLSVYIISRLYKLLGQMLKFDPDLRYDFKEFMETIGENMAKIPTMMKVAHMLRFDAEWLIRYEIPDDIVALHKALKANRLVR